MGQDSIVLPGPVFLYRSFNSKNIYEIIFDSVGRDDPNRRYYAGIGIMTFTGGIEDLFT